VLGAYSPVTGMDRSYRGSGCPGPRGPRGRPARRGRCQVDQLLVAESRRGNLDADERVQPRAGWVDPQQRRPATLSSSTAVDEPTDWSSAVGRQGCRLASLRTSRRGGRRRVQKPMWLRGPDRSTSHRPSSPHGRPPTTCESRQVESAKSTVAPWTSSAGTRRCVTVSRKRRQFAPLQPAFEDRVSGASAPGESRSTKSTATYLVRLEPLPSNGVRSNLRSRVRVGLRPTVRTMVKYEVQARRFRCTMVRDERSDVHCPDGSAGGRGVVVRHLARRVRATVPSR
jgi:hypothetical protein